MDTAAKKNGPSKKGALENDPAASPPKAPGLAAPDMKSKDQQLRMECYLQKLLSGEELSDEERVEIGEVAKEAGYPMIANLEIPWEGTDDIDFENRGFRTSTKADH
ncbi:hypothetical protein EMPG_16641 [Blastomyces silverae]|uniref:Uncharacterized protein n=1 Tax=Blastomyces silverae TaxID=2060906 RepID=A0A0H1B942_9EURO|nr:hypothetical protein EMPG_16641 [Blastomyces silverae]